MDLEAPDQATVPNHHAQFPSFSGLGGMVVGLAMLLRSDDDARAAAHLSELAPGDTVADIGCGPGVAVRYAARLGASAIGVDPAPVMVRLAALTTRRTDRARSRFVEGSAEALPLEPASMAVVWSMASVHHWTDLDAGLAEVHRVLVPGGRLVVIERRTKPGARSLASHGWTDAQVAAFAEHCRAHGFEDVRWHIERHGRRFTWNVTARRP